MIASLRSENYSALCARHQDFRMKLTSRTTALDFADALFRIHESSAAASGAGTAIAFQSVNFPEYFVAAQADRTVCIERLSVTDPRTLFFTRPGLANASSCSLESAAFVGHFLRHAGFLLFVHPPDGSDLFRKDATWRWETAGSSAAAPPSCLAAPVSAVLPLAKPLTAALAVPVAVAMPFPASAASAMPAPLHSKDQQPPLRSAAAPSTAASGVAVAAAGAGFIRLESKAKPGCVVRHHDTVVRISDVPLPRTAVDAQFRMVPAVNGQAGCVSFEALDHPGSFLR